ncbi:MAG: hypothetical protein FWG17_04705 [Desulfovibrionaceae bacterium]|nr:hypothetical protein [Desulfovibrionaceae bacterium]
MKKIWNALLSRPLPGLIFSVLGLTYCLFMSFAPGAELLCLSSGCAASRALRVAGISPWWAASLIFFLLAGLCALRLRLAARSLAALFLAGDILFLLAMAGIGPCASCLFVALLIFCAWKSLWPASSGPARFIRPLTGLLQTGWCILFIINLGAILGELPPSPLPGTSENKKISLYFSPSCPACLTALRQFSESAILCPIAENDEDALFIAALAEKIRDGSPTLEALEELLADRRDGKLRPPTMTRLDTLRLRAGLWRNQALAARHGGQTLPVIVLSGLPAAWPSPAPVRPPETKLDSLAPIAPIPTLPLDLGETLECPRHDEEPCQ